MDRFTILFLLQHNPNLGYVFRQGQYQELLPTSRFTKDELNRMTTYIVPRPQYTYIYAVSEQFKTLQAIQDYIN